MRARVHILPADPARQHLAAMATCGHACAEFPRRRAAILVTLGWAAQPGLCVAPWTLSGVAQAIGERGQAARRPISIGEPGADRATLVAIGDHHFADSSRAAAPVSLDLPGFASPARVPGEWFGSCLYLLTPLAHYHDASRARPGGGARAELSEWAGPLRTALATLARHCGLAGSLDTQARAGARLAREVFADAVCVVDATWWAAVAAERRGRARRHGDDDRPPPRRLAGELVAPEHCVATRAIRDIDATAAVDAWLASLLGLHAHDGGASTPRVLGRRTAWPETRLASWGQAPDGLAGRAVEALWGHASRFGGRRHDDSGGRLRLLGARTASHAQARVTAPGRFGAAWEHTTAPDHADAPP